MGCEAKAGALVHVSRLQKLKGSEGEQGRP